MMEQSGENSAAQDGSDTPPETRALGAALREARERLGLSVADVANQTKLAPRQIEALEVEDFRHLPEMPFVRGFVRSYAKILQLDDRPLLAALPQDDGSAKPLTHNSVNAPFPTARSAQQQNLIWLGMALLLSVLVVAFAVWHFTAPPSKPPAAQAGTAEAPPDDARAPAAQVPDSTIKPAIEATPVSPGQTEKTEAAPAATMAADAKIPETKPRPSALPQKAVLRLAFDEESWVEVKNKDGEVLSSQINPRGSELYLDGQAPFALVIGRATSVRLYYRGQPVDLTPHIRRSTDVAFLTLE